MSMSQCPDRWTFASSGTGTGQHLAGELFNSMAGTQMTHIPYRGGGQAVSDIMGGQVSLGMLGLTPVLSHIQSGALKAYAVTTPYRIPSLPDVPTMEEAGLKGYDATQYFVMAAPAGIDPAIVDKLNASIATAVEAIKLGASHYLAKPSNTDDIEAAFERAEGDVNVELTQRQTSIKTLEWERIHEMLAETNFNISETARRLGMHRRTLARKLEKHRVK